MSKSSEVIQFKAKPYQIKKLVILRLPKDASVKLPSRALAMVEGTINDVSFKTVLEPDGRGSHWFRVDNALLKKAKVQPGSTVKMEIWLSKDWIEPEMPEDFKKVLESYPKEYALWKDITPNARWDWIRWIRAVKTPETRQKHINVAIDKLKKGMRRPCCFNRNLCSEPYVSNNGVLIEPTQTTETK
jgi:hypothetical protein